MELLKKVKETINKHSMLSEGDRVLIGLSGGPDSVCLAVILDKLKNDFNLTLSAVYIDHGLRPDEVEAEKAFCKTFCERLGIDFFYESLDVKQYAKDEGLNKQEAARELRYRVFEEAAWRIDAKKVALGHNADDQAETFFMRLLRGAGPGGLSGIPPVRSLELRVKSVGAGLKPARTELRVKKNILIIRPLIEIEREDIETFLTSDPSLVTRHPSLPYVVDSSNLEKDYFRNWVRLSVITEMKKRNPALTQNICRTMDIFREEERYFDIIVTKTLMKLICGKTDSRINLFLTPLEAMDKVILRRVLRRAVDETTGLRGVEFIHIEDMIFLIKNGRPGDRLYLPKGLRVIKDYSTLVITSEAPKRLGSYKLNAPGEIALKESGLIMKASLEEDVDGCGGGKTTAIFDADKTGPALTVRSREDGDFFYPLGFGKRKKLQDFFTDEKIPRDERDTVPIVLSGDDIVWIAGYRADERFKVTEKTKRFLRLIISKL